jgi:tetratricopeptide (TPR) repeat protein
MILLAVFPALRGDAVEDLLRQGDELFAQRQDPGQARQALARFREAARLAPDRFEALVRNAQAVYYVGDLAAGKDEKKMLFQEGMDLSRRMIALRPERVEGHYWLGVHTGSYGEARGVLKSLFLKNDIIRAMERSIAIDGAYEQGGAYCVLGRLYYKVPGLFGGSKKRSRQYLETCRRIAPKSSVCLLFLAETYWALDEEELAIRVLQDLLAMEPDPLWLPETAQDKAEGEKLLKKYRD